MSILTGDIIELNRDMEPYIIQGATTRTWLFGDKFKPLQFVHFSDIHAVLDLWNRIVQYTNHYRDYIDFAIHTGDYCGNNQALYADFYNYGIKCERPIYNCVGNHDTYVTRQWTKSDKGSVHKLLFASMDDDSNNVNFLECDFSMTYYKDFPDSNVRLIVIDLYYDIEIQCEWLKDILSDAKEKELCVITAMHEPLNDVKDTYGVTFYTKNQYSPIEKEKSEHKAFENIIADFISCGGCHICNLVGHKHYDLFGLTESGILHTAVPSATNWNGYCDGRRIKGTRTYDCFNVVSIDANLGLLKIARIGNNIDHYFRSQHSLCYDYINKKLFDEN